MTPGVFAAVGLPTAAPGLAVPVLVGDWFFALGVACFVVPDDDFGAPLVARSFAAADFLAADAVADDLAVEGLPALLCLAGALGVEDFADDPAVEDLPAVAEADLLVVLFLAGVVVVEDFVNVRALVDD